MTDIREHLIVRCADLQHCYWDELQGTRFHYDRANPRNMDNWTLAEFFEDLVRHIALS